MFEFDEKDGLKFQLWNNKEALTCVCSSGTSCMAWSPAPAAWFPPIRVKIPSNICFCVFWLGFCGNWFHTSMQKKRGTRMRIILRIRMRKSLSTAARSLRASFYTETEAGAMRGDSSGTASPQAWESAVPQGWAPDLCCRFSCKKNTLHCWHEEEEDEARQDLHY